MEWDKKCRPGFSHYLHSAEVTSKYWDRLRTGLLQRHFKNRWLRDKLTIPDKRVYFVAMVYSYFNNREGGMTLLLSTCSVNVLLDENELQNLNRNIHHLIGRAYYKS